MDPGPRSSRAGTGLRILLPHRQRRHPPSAPRVTFGARRWLSWLRPRESSMEMAGIGKTLRETRLKWQLTLREVEERSSQLAQKWQNPAYRISASWLDRVERENRELSATKLIVLAVLYGLSADQMLGLIPSTDTDNKLDQVSAPNSTLLLVEGPLEEHARQWLPDSFMAETPPETTTLLHSEPGML